MLYYNINDNYQFCCHKIFQISFNTRGYLSNYIITIYRGGDEFLGDESSGMNLPEDEVSCYHFECIE